ncbi:iron-containing alcohol dehydrogenase family protein [Bacillus sp. Marseille-P3661]|uniref:iron-containing alcohol dehydrogenase family protein n=1 Tax=Bacillus sp. Marseille-P3661 TaxID=1936234 RepID=UPI0015E17EB7|nr:iron-containing alcohol dehydrogenase family protein [Bacillus sp. Marseille-P3661]
MFTSMAYPTNYIQRPGALKEVGGWITKFGAHPLIIAGPTAWEKSQDKIKLSLAESSIDYELEYFQGHCSDTEFKRLLSKVPPSTDIILGVGGGQCLDMAKLLANYLDIPIITVSTLASTCAASSPVSIIYTTEHVFVRVENFDRCPVVAIVDPDIIRDAPLRYLSAGIGDTIVKWYEAFPVNNGFLNTRTQAGLKMAELAKDLLFEYGEQALIDCQQGITGKSLCQVIDTNILLGGLVGGLGSETCKASGAHAIHYGMTNIPEMKNAYHGELVAFGLLCQFKLEGKSDKVIIEMMNFYKKVNLPICLSDLTTADISEAALYNAAKGACAPGSTIHLLPYKIREQDVYEAIVEIHRLGETVKKEPTNL